MIRVLAAVGVVLVVCACASAQPASAPAPRPTLAHLTQEYQRYGLPLLPPKVQLVRVNRDRYTEHHREEPIPDRLTLMFRVPPAKPGERVQYVEIGFDGVGYRDLDYVEPAAVEDAKPTREAVQGIEIERFLAGEWLTLAIQAKVRGWDDFATACYDRAREAFGTREEYQSVQAELRHIAWMFWADRLRQRGTDRAEVLRRLDAIRAESKDFQTPRTDQFLAQVKLTLAPRTAKPGSVEALIDELTEYCSDPFESKPRDEASYWKLAEMGFDAVPALIKHVNDNRLTRGSWQGFQIQANGPLTVGHLCSRLLYDLSARSIGGGYWEKRGDRLKPDEARKWFEKAQKVGEEKWLLHHAVPKDGGGVIVNEEGRPETLIVRVLGAKYPARFPGVYRELLNLPARSSEWSRLINPAALVATSRLTRAQKLELLDEGLQAADVGHQVLSLSVIAELDPPRFRKSLLDLLRALQVHTWLWKVELVRVDHLVRLAEASADRSCWDALVGVIKVSDPVTRSFAMWVLNPALPDRPDPNRVNRIRALVAFLDDTAIGTDEIVNSEVRDDAAVQLAGLLGFTVKRLTETYWAVPDRERGPLARLAFRVIVRQAAADALARAR